MGEAAVDNYVAASVDVYKRQRLFFTPEGGRETKVEAVRAHKGMCLVKLKGVDSIDAAPSGIRRTPSLVQYCLVVSYLLLTHYRHSVRHLLPDETTSANQALA